MTVIVLSWNSKAWIADCLRGLLANEARPVYVVDNGSSDGSPELIARDFPGVRLIRSPANLGFGGGNNLGMKAAFEDGCDAVFLLNNDTIIDQPFIEPCITSIMRDSTPGIIGPIIVEGNAPDLVQSRGGNIGLWTLDFSYRGRGEAYVPSETVEAVDFVLGAAMLIPRRVYEETRGFDEEFFPAYVEEADLCFRARKAGFRSSICHASRVRHLEAASSGGRDRSFRLYTANRFRFAVKHLGPIRFFVASQCVVIRTFAHKIMGLGGFGR